MAGKNHFELLSGISKISKCATFCAPCGVYVLTESKLVTHRMRGIAPAVLTATGQVNGRWRILTHHRIETHKPTATKFRTIDYVRERTP